MVDGDESASSEPSLARRMAEGDESALVEVYDRFSPFVYGLAKRVIGDGRAAEDVTQEVFVQLWDAPERFDASRGSMRSFLGTLAHRRSVDLIRREEARRRREDRTSFEASPITASDDEAMSDVMAERVRAAVARLPSAQREAVDLAYFQGHTYRQVASMLGIPEGTAKSRLRVALAHIAETLHPELHEQWA